jgi:hydroxymethylbilane synthase
MNFIALNPLPTLRVATRESPLALAQARLVAEQLSSYATCELVPMTTRGDQILDQPLNKVGGKGLFIKELEVAMEEGRADFAVHSLKDVPMVLPRGFMLAAMLEREDPRDAFVSARFDSLAKLPSGAKVGTSSLRRMVNLRRAYPALTFVPIRGNVGTRLKKMEAGECDALILATAGLKRLGLVEKITSYLSIEESLPAPGQAALGLECRTTAEEEAEILNELDHAPTAVCCSAERAVSRALGGSCDVPLAAYATLDGFEIHLRAWLANESGTQFAQAEARGMVDDPEGLGVLVAEQLRRSLK